LFENRLQTVEEVAWDGRGECVSANREVRLGALVLERAIQQKPDGAAVTRAMAEGIKAMGIAALPWNESARAIQSRISFLRRIEGDKWPDLSDGALIADPQGWLGERLNGIFRRSHLGRLDLAEALLAQLDWQQRRDLDVLAPSHMTTPTGRSVALDYSGDLPVLAVKLQEMFGQRATPAVAGGRVAVVVQLLSPAGRPLQTTRDLQGFWQTGYAAVRAEMRGRYPRHPWPDDPLTAPPQRGVKRR
jgi:ATP-dependent helicase HrpB